MKREKVKKIKMPALKADKKIVKEIPILSFYPDGMLKMASGKYIRICRVDLIDDMRQLFEVEGFTQFLAISKKKNEEEIETILNQVADSALYADMPLYKVEYFAVFSVKAETAEKAKESFSFPSFLTPLSAKETVELLRECYHPHGCEAAEWDEEYNLLSENKAAAVLKDRIAPASLSSSSSYFLLNGKEIR